MGRERDFLINSIRLALAGHTIGAEELASIVAHPGTLDRIEKAALIALNCWSEDAEIRASHRRWDRFGRQRLNDLSTSLAMVSGDV